MKRFFKLALCALSNDSARRHPPIVVFEPFESRCLLSAGAPTITQQTDNTTSSTVKDLTVHVPADSNGNATDDVDFNWTFADGTPGMTSAQFADGGAWTVNTDKSVDVKISLPVDPGGDVALHVVANYGGGGTGDALDTTLTRTSILAPASPLISGSAGDGLDGTWTSETTAHISSQAEWHNAGITQDTDTTADGDHGDHHAATYAGQWNFRVRDRYVSPYRANAVMYSAWTNNSANKTLRPDPPESVYATQSNDTATNGVPQASVTVGFSTLFGQNASNRLHVTRSGGIATRDINLAAGQTSYNFTDNLPGNGSYSYTATIGAKDAFGTEWLSQTSTSSDTASYLTFFIQWATLAPSFAYQQTKSLVATITAGGAAATGTATFSTSLLTLTSGSGSVSGGSLSTTATSLFDPGAGNTATDSWIIDFLDQNGNHFSQTLEDIKLLPN